MNTFNSANMGMSIPTFYNLDCSILTGEKQHKITTLKQNHKYMIIHGELWSMFTISGYSIWTIFTKNPYQYQYGSIFVRLKREKLDGDIPVLR